MNKRRLLICVQAVDLDDPLMGFFVPWLVEAATSFSQITVLALRVGRYQLPQNVTVIPLRPATSRSKVLVIATLLRESWRRRDAYDAVFVRGDAVYVIVAAWLWRLLGKKVIFWFAHYKVSRAAVWAARCARVTVTSVKAAFDHPHITPLCIGQNVDHTRFSAPEKPVTGAVRCLVFGSVRRVKRVEYAIHSFLNAGGEMEQATLTIAGPRTDAAYESTLRALADGHPSIQWADAVAYDKVPTLLNNYDIILNPCPGSLDKVILEGMMSGLVVIAATPGMKGWLPAHLEWLCVATLDEMTHALKKVFTLSAAERWSLGAELRSCAIAHHSTQQQVQKIATLVDAVPIASVSRTRRILRYCIVAGVAALLICAGILIKRPYLIKTLLPDLLPKTYVLETGDWDQSIREIGNIVFNERTGEYILYYSGLRGENRRNNNEVFVGAATSKDKQSWSKIGKVMDAYAEDPFVIYCRDAFWMFYEEKSRLPDNSISIARSDDGRRFEVVKTDIVVPKADSFQSRDTSSPVAVCLEGKVVVLYEARDIQKEGATLGYAESTDFTTWKQADQPVFTLQYEGGYIVPDDIQKKNNTFSLSYHDVDRTLSKGKTTWLSHRLDSHDLQHWTAASQGVARRDYTMFFDSQTLMTSDERGIYTFNPFLSL